MKARVEADLRTLYQHAEGFHFSEAAIRALHQRVGRALEAGAQTDDLEAGYRAALRKYFASFDTQTRAQLRDVDRRLAELAQAQLNFNAERNVAVKRLENIGTMLALLDEATA